MTDDRLRFFKLRKATACCQTKILKNDEDAGIYRCDCGNDHEATAQKEIDIDRNKKSAKREK